MDIKKILAKMAKGEELTAEEKTFVASYDPDKASNDVAAAARRKSEEELKKVQAKLDELTAETDAAKKKAEQEKQTGMTEIEKLTATVKTLTDKVTASDAKVVEAEKKSAATVRSQTIRDKAKAAGITLAPKTVNEKLFFQMLEASVGDVDINDPAKLTEVLNSFKAENAGIISAGGAGGAGEQGNPATGIFTGKNPWSKDGFSLTEQVKLESDAPDKAKAFKAEAGVS